MHSNKCSEDVNKEIYIVNQKLSKRTTELENALQIKNEFLNNLSYEVRTPIQGVITLSKGLINYWNEYSEDEKFQLKVVNNNIKERLISCDRERMTQVIRNILVNVIEFTVEGKIT
ncbi:MAG: hypothetical protein AB8U25_03440 [Rickettsiales endosymbiont of Dermacentor nuttalli]